MVNKKPDMASYIGVVVAIGSVVLGIILEFNHLNPDLGSAFLQMSAILIIFGGTIGTTLMSFPMEEFKKFPVLMKIAFVEERHRPKDLIDTLVSLAELARREGVLALENKMPELSKTHPFLARAFRNVIDGLPPEKLKEILSDEIVAMEERHKVGAGLFNAMGGYAPTMGIIGTVVGLIGALAQAGGGHGDSSAIVSAIAAAFIATFYGIASANLVFLPIAGKLQLRTQHEVFLKLVQSQGVLAVQNGDNPRSIGHEMSVFFREHDLK